MIFAHNMSDGEREEISEKVRSLAKFEAGDKVTVPYPKYGGGYLLTIDEPVWGEDNLEYAERQVGPDEFVHVSEHKEDFDPERVVGDYYISSVSYSFVEKGFVSEKEFSLVPWSEYDGTMKLPTNSDDEFKFVKEEDCDICGCNRIIRSGFDNGVIGGGHEYCPVCEDIKDEWHP